MEPVKPVDPIFQFPAARVHFSPQLPKGADPKQRLRDKNLKVPFAIGDEEAGTYTIQLTDEQAALLPKEGKE